MICYTTTGLCSSSLQKTCLVVGIVFLLVGIANNCVGIVYRCSPIILAMDGVFLIGCVCLILAAQLRNKFLCIPWVFGYICTAIALVLVILTELAGIGEYTKVEALTVKAIAHVVVVALIFILETILSRYVYSYFMELREEYRRRSTVGMSISY